MNCLLPTSIFISGTLFISRQVTSVTTTQHLHQRGGKGVGRLGRKVVVSTRRAANGHHSGGRGHTRDEGGALGDGLVVRAVGGAGARDVGRGEHALRVVGHGVERVAVGVGGDVAVVDVRAVRVAERRVGGGPRTLHSVLRRDPDAVRRRESGVLA